MSEGRNELTDSGESDGIVSGTFPAADSLLVEVFEGCCCVADCNAEEKQAQQDAGTMDGMPCCPQTNPPGAGKSSAEAQQPPPEYAGMCEQIKLQLSLIGGPYYKFAVAFDDVDQFLAIGTDMFGKRFRLLGNIARHNSEAFDDFGPTETDQRVHCGRVLGCLLRNLIFFDGHSLSLPTIPK